MVSLQKKKKSFPWLPPGSPGENLMKISGLGQVLKKVIGFKKLSVSVSSNTVWVSGGQDVC